MAHDRQLRRCESCGERECIGMYSQSAGQPEMMLYAPTLAIP